MNKKKLDTSSLVRISNKHIRLAKRVKKLSGVPVGKTFEAALDYYNEASKNLDNTAIALRNDLTSLVVNPQSQS